MAFGFFYVCYVMVFNIFWHTHEMIKSDTAILFLLGHRK